MPNEKVWIKKRERDLRIQARRTALVIELSRDGYSFGEIEEILRINRASAHRIMKYGKNISKPVAAS